MHHSSLNVRRIDETGMKTIDCVDAHTDACI
jgi:hypothetical protein